MQRDTATRTILRLWVALTVSLFLTAPIIKSVPSVYADARLLNRRDKLSTSTVGAIASHDIRFTLTEFDDPLGSIVIQFCGNSPIIGDVCNQSSGLDASAVTIENQTGETGFTVHGNSDENNVILTRTPTIPTASEVGYELDNIINPTGVGTFYVRITTLVSSDGTGSAVQYGGIAISTTASFDVTTEVPPFLRFCAGITIDGFDCNTAENFVIDLGEFTTAEAKTASSQMVAVTNAPHGYSIVLSGTTLTSGNNEIPALTSQAASTPGSGQFGINLRANSAPPIGSDPVGPGTANVRPEYNAADLFRYKQGEVVAGAIEANNYRKFTVSYIANIGSDQQPGYYATTISFICLANF